MLSPLIFTHVLSFSLWASLKELLASGLEGLFSITNAVGLPSYALAIVMFTIILKVVLYPLTVKQMRSMRDMQRLQPLLKEIQTKYKNDQKMLQEKQMELYKEHKINPFGGCLPLLVQLPILYALFAVLRNFTPSLPQYYNFFWIADLSQPDPTKIILPVLVGLSTFFQQFVSSTNRQDPTQKAMLYVMPLMIGWMTVKFASGLAIYWVCFNIIGGIQQYIINKRSLPLIAAEKGSVQKETKSDTDNETKKEVKNVNKKGNKKNTKKQTK